MTIDEKLSTGFALMAELQNYEQQGISIWLDNSPSSPDRVLDTLRVEEELSFMRDYVFRDGELEEVRFNRVEKP